MTKDKQHARDLTTDNNSDSIGAMALDKAARELCFRDPTGTCHDNYCGATCRAVRPDKRFFDQALAQTKSEGSQ